jgi:sterol desaturase/sphingolipid hydroxylase (fatty acid hydroxylase superfamily)
VQAPGVYCAIHAKHHERKVQRACEAMRLTVVEEALDVAASVMAVNLTRAHPLSRTVCNVVIVWLIIELHSGALRTWASALCAHGNYPIAHGCLVGCSRRSVGAGCQMAWLCRV